METNEDMEIEPMVFEVREIDPEYEFDAAKWYDFTQEESTAEARAAELWFVTAQSYPPSPFVIKLLLREDVRDDKSELSTKSENDEAAADICDTDRETMKLPNHLAPIANKTGNGTHTRIFSSQGDNSRKTPNESSYKGPTFSNRLQSDKLKCRPKSSIKPIPRSSTLMKPTASQLAKQNHARLNVQAEQLNEKGISGSSNEIQAAKRQKLEGGLLHKVSDMKQETYFVHKTPKMDVTFDRNLHQARTKITISQEPGLVTAQRAHRIRHQNDAQSDQASTAVYRFKARPFNRKIFDTPSLPIRKKTTPKLPEFHEFHLKTSERAMQHSSAVTATSYKCNESNKGSEKPSTNTVLDGVNRESRRRNAMNTSKHDLSTVNRVFKARTLNKKVLSKGDIRISRNSKKEEFNFHGEEKRVHLDVPTELLSKLSLTSDLQPSDGSRSRFPRRTCGPVKGFKENRLNSFQAGHEITSNIPETSICSSECQMQQYGNSGIIPETSQPRTDRRSLGIR